QDLEWCLAGDQLFLVQARPITSLYPLPPAPADGALHVHISFSHAQNMTDPLSPLGANLWQIMFPLGKTHLTEIPRGPTPMAHVGGRIYVDTTAALRLAPTRRVLLRILRAVYPDLAAGVADLA